MVSAIDIHWEAQAGYWTEVTPAIKGFTTSCVPDYVTSSAAPNYSSHLSPPTCLHLPPCLHQPATCLHSTTHMSLPISHMSPPTTHMSHLPPYPPATCLLHPPAQAGVLTHGDVGKSVQLLVLHTQPHSLGLVFSVIQFLHTLHMHGITPSSFFMSGGQF